MTWTPEPTSSISNPKARSVPTIRDAVRSVKPSRATVPGAPALADEKPSATSERLLGSSPIPLSFVAYCVRLQLRIVPSTGITRLHRYYKPLRHPNRPGLSLASCQLIQPQSPLGLPVLRSVPFAYMPSPLPRQVGGSRSLILFPSSAFPKSAAGRLLHPKFRGLLSVHSRYGLHACRVAFTTLFHRRLQQLCYLHRYSDCHRTERTSSRVGLAPTVD